MSERELIHRAYLVRIGDKPYILRTMGQKRFGSTNFGYIWNFFDLDGRNVGASIRLEDDHWELGDPRIKKDSLAIAPVELSSRNSRRVDPLATPIPVQLTLMRPIGVPTPSPGPKCSQETHRLLLNAVRHLRPDRSGFLTWDTAWKATVQDVPAMQGRRVGHSDLLRVLRAQGWTEIAGGCLWRHK